MARLLNISHPRFSGRKRSASSPWSRAAILRGRTKLPDAPVADRGAGPLLQLGVEDNVGDGLLRISRELIKKALALISQGSDDRAEELHQVRVINKRLRALLRLVRPVVSREFFARENRRLKKVADRLALFRDDAVSQHTLERIATMVSSAREKKAFHRVREVFTGRGLEPGTLERRREEAMRKAARDLREANRSFQAMLIPAEEWHAVGPGLLKAYRRARNHMLRPLTEGTEEAFHEWRKHVKCLHYQLQMLEPAWPKRLGTMVRRLKKLEEKLGKDHDLAVLERLLSDSPEASGGQREVKHVTACLGRQCKKLRRETVALGKEIFREKPRKFARKFSQRWNAWHRPGEGNTLL